MKTEAQEPIRNPPAFLAVGQVGALLAAVVAIGWSIGKRGRGWLAAVGALLASTAALGWVAWTFLLLVRSAA